MAPSEILKSQDSNQQCNCILLELNNPAQIGTTLTGENVFLGGFSGLSFAGKSDKNEFNFFTITDRGPNAEIVSIPGVGPNSRPFLLPEFQPRILKLQTNMSDKTFSVIKEIRLTDPNGLAVSGLPQATMIDHDQEIETAVNLRGEFLFSNAFGIDSEGLTVDDAGNFWVVEEYRPSILKFDQEGKLIKSFIPQELFSKQFLAAEQLKYGQIIYSEALPEILKTRKINRGFEGITYKDNKIYAIMQSPLSVDLQGEVPATTLIIELDITTEKTTAIYRYPMHRSGVDKIGDIAFNFSGELFAIEQNSKVGAEGIHLITRIDLKEDLSTVTEEFSLANRGFDFVEKVEGLAFISKSEFAVINDNDYGVEGSLDQPQNQVAIGKRKSVLAIFSVN